MKRKFICNVLSLIITFLVILQAFPAAAIHAASSDNLGTVKVIVGDYTTRPDSVLKSTSSKYANYKEPFGDIVSVTVPIAEGDTMYDSISKALATKGIKCNTTGSGTSVYIASIGPVTSADGKRTVDSLGQFNGGPMSGWMGSLNDWYVNMGFGNWKVSDGDIIDMEFTCQGLGKDLGQWWDTSNPPDTSLKDVQVIGGELNQKFDPAVKDYTINVPYGTKSIQLNQTATNKANNAQIFVGDTYYKRFKDIPITNGSKINIYCGKSLKNDTSIANSIYTFTISQPVPNHVSDDAINNTVNNIVKWYKQGNTYLMNSDFLQYVGSTAGDWMPIGAARCGINDNYSAYLDAISKYVTDKYKENEKLSDCKATEWERISLAIGSLGGDPTKIGKDDKGNPINLIADGTYNSIVNYEDQGINAFVFGLITLDARNYSVPDGAKYTREDIIKGILSYQMSCGGFSFGADGGSEGSADPDMTAMAIQALAPYYNDSKTYTYALGDKTVTKSVHQVVEEALNSIRGIQKQDGDFASWGTANVESTDQVIVALCSLGIDPEKDSRFITSTGKTPIDGLLKYVMKDGGIAHTLETGSNGMATDQTLYTLAAIKRQRAGVNRLYDYTDVKYLVSQPVINVQPGSKTLNEGEDLNLTISASVKDNGTLSYQWYKNGQQIDGAASANYKISNAKEADSGDYYVIVTNTINEAKESVTSSKASITVLKAQQVKPEKPEIKTQPQSKTLNEGEELTLSVAASINDKGTLSYQWYKDGKEISGANSTSYKISSVKEADSGSYFAIITNTLNGAKESVTSDTAKITVNKVNSDNPDQPSTGQIYTTDKDYQTGISSAEIPASTIKGTGDKVVNICVVGTPINLSIPTALLPLDSAQSIRIEEKELTINSPISSKESMLVSPFELSLYSIDIKGNSTKISDFGNSKITLSFAVDKNKLNDFELDTLKLYYYNGTEWVEVTDAKYNPNTGIITAGTAHFSTFAIAGVKKAASIAQGVSQTSSITSMTKGLPQTGSFMNTEALMLMGFISAASGVFILFRRKDN